MSASSFPHLSLGLLAMLAGVIACSVTRIHCTQAMGIVLTTTLLVGLASGARSIPAPPGSGMGCIPSLGSIPGPAG